MLLNRSGFINKTKKYSYRSILFIRGHVQLKQPSLAKTAVG